jgi:predicted Fe-Mo cluster-binding NifX family protein
MKIAVPVKSDGSIDAHFGHCDQYQLFTISEDKQIINTEILPSTQGCGCKSNIASTLEQLGVSIMISGGIGDGAVNKLKMHHITAVRNCQGDAAENVLLYLHGEILDGGTNCASHDADHECQHDE